MQCYACSREASGQCPNCGQWFCSTHGRGRCDRCRDIPGGYPSSLFYRATLGLLALFLGLAGWHLLAWPQFPAPAPRAAFSAESGIEAGDVALPPTPSAPQATPADAVQPTATPAPAQPTPTPTSVPTPQPTPTRTPVPAALPSPGRYIVQPGDNLLGIALRYGITLDALLAANPSMQDPALISIGQELIIP